MVKCLASVTLKMQPSTSKTIPTDFTDKLFEIISDGKQTNDDTFLNDHNSKYFSQNKFFHKKM